MADKNPHLSAERLRRLEELKETALGLVSTRSFPAIVGTADMMLKSAGVTLVGYEKIGSGYCTAVVRGGIASVRLAVAAGVETAEKFGQLVSSSVIPRPLANLEAVLPISVRLAELSHDRRHSRLSNLAVGLLETRGFPAMVGAADAMLKTADVQLAGYETIGDGLCTIVIRGAVADVAMAVEAGMHEAERIGELHSVMVIPRPLDDLEETLPIASCWLEHPQPLPTLVPLATPQETAIPLQLPDLQEVPVPLHKTEPMRRQAETVQAETVQVEIVKPDPTDDR